MTSPAKASGKPLRVLHLTDPHLFADPAGELRGTVTHASLVETLDHYREQEWRADVVSVTGDLIQDNSAEAYEHFKSLLGSLGLEVHCVPGNHDVRGLMQAALASAPFHYCAATEVGGWLMVGIDSCLDGTPGGRVTDAEFDRLDAAIAASDARHVLVCLHHPPVAMNSRWLDRVGLENGDDFLERLTRSGRVRAAIFGHVHQLYDEVHDGIRIIATPSTCRQFKPHSDDFAVDDRPPAYRRIELYDNGEFATELIWLKHA